MCLAKAIGGGISTAAIGGTEEVMGLIADGSYEQVGTFNGNPLAMAATRAMLTEVMDRRGVRPHQRLRERDRPGSRTSSSARAALARRHGRREGVRRVPARAHHNFRDFLQVDDRFGDAHWLVQHNGGVFLPPWGKIEQWLISVQHTDEDMERFVANVDRLARAVRAE